MVNRLAAAVGTGAVLVALLTSCSGAGAAPAPGAPAAADPATAADRDAVRATFTRYTQALLDRDFTLACATLTEQARQALVDDLRSKNIPAQSCDQAYGALYSVDEAAKRLDAANHTVQITDVTVTGESATLTYTGTVGGKPVPPQTVRAQRSGGIWRIATSG